VPLAARRFSPRNKKKLTSYGNKKSLPATARLAARMAAQLAAQLTAQPM